MNWSHFTFMNEWHDFSQVEIGIKVFEIWNSGNSTLCGDRVLIIALSTNSWCEDRNLVHCLQFWTYRDWDKTDVIFQTTFSNAFLTRGQMTKSHQWARSRRTLTNHRVSQPSLLTLILTRCVWGIKMLWPIFEYYVWSKKATPKRNNKTSKHTSKQKATQNKHHPNISLFLNQSTLLSIRSMGYGIRNRFQFNCSSLKAAYA